MTVTNELAVVPYSVDEVRPSILPSRQLDRLAFEPRTWEDAMRTAVVLCKGRLLPPALASNPEAVVTILVLGRELGLTISQSIRGIHVIDGKPSISAQLMVSLVLQSGLAERFDLTVSTAEIATYVTRRRGSQHDTTLSWTIEQARTAGLLGKGPWKAYPQAMLRARASAELCRAVYPDVVSGLYDPEELTTTASDARVEVSRPLERDTRPQPRPESKPEPAPSEPPVAHDSTPAPLTERQQAAADLEALELAMGGRVACVAAFGTWPRTPRQAKAYLAQAAKYQAGKLVEKEAEVHPKNGQIPITTAAEFQARLKPLDLPAERLEKEAWECFGVAVSSLNPWQRTAYLTLLEAGFYSEDVGADLVELYGAKSAQDATQGEWAAYLADINSGAVGKPEGDL